MVKTTLKIDGMMCSMCEAHMNDLVRQNCKAKKVTSSAKNGETVVISEEPLDISMLDKEIKGIGYTMLSHESEPYENTIFQTIIQKATAYDAADRYETVRLFKEALEQDLKTACPSVSHLTIKMR